MAEVDVPLAFYEWLAGVERDVRVHDLTPHEISALSAAFQSAAPASAGGKGWINPMVDREINWLVHQLEAWPHRVDPERTINIETLMQEAAKVIRRQVIPAAPAPDNGRERLVEALREIASMGYAGAPDIRMRQIARAALQSEGPQQ